MQYIIEQQNAYGTRSKVKTKHGIIKCPNFIFCATKGAIKGTTLQAVKEQNTQMILSNTVHLLPYSKHIKSMGGLHKFMQWNRPLLTDSGGYQMFSWAHGGVSDEIKGIRRNRTNRCSFKEDGCEFSYPNTNRKVLLTPELSMEVQIDLGVDFVVALDRCTPSSLDYFDTKITTEQSHYWEKRSLDYFNKNKQKHQELLGIVQGGIHYDLRKNSVDFVKNNNFWGYCIGGSLGTSKEEMYDIVRYTCSLLNDNNKKFVHLLGIGETKDILNLVSYGIDSFDCVHPTRIARHGAALLSYFYEGRDNINITNKRFKNDEKPIDDSCLCDTCKQYSRAYLHYLFSVQEMSGITLLVNHNIFRMNRLMEEIRDGIATETFNSVKNRWLTEK